MLFQAELWQPCPTIARSLNLQQPQKPSQENISLQFYYSYSIQCTMYAKMIFKTGLLPNVNDRKSVALQFYSLKLLFLIFK